MAGKVIICDKNAGASGGGRGLKTVVLSVYRFIGLLQVRPLPLKVEKEHAITRDWWQGAFSQYISQMY